MKLYGWMKGDRGTVKKGSNKALSITLEYEEPGQSWECNSSAHELRLVFNVIDGKPSLGIYGNPSVEVVDVRQVTVA